MEDDEPLRKKLWLRIAKHVIEQVSVVRVSIIRGEHESASSDRCSLVFFEVYRFLQLLNCVLAQKNKV